MLKPTDNPPLLPPGVATPADLTGTWWVAHTKPRAEKALAWDLLARRVGYYLPLATRTAVWGGRRRTVSTAVFPSYLFFAGSPEDRHTVLATGRVVGVIPVPLQAQLAAELADVHRAVASKLTLDLYPFAAVGRRCRVTRGPLRGTEGVVVRRDDMVRLVLTVSLLGQRIALHVSADQLEPVE